MVWGAFLLELTSETGIGFPMGMMGLLGTALLGLVWLGVLVGGRTGGTHARRWLAWLVFPVVGAAIALIFLTTQSAMNPFFRLRFLLSRPALQAAVRTPPDRSGPSHAGWVGLFKVQRVDRFGDSAHFITVSCGVVDECGIAYVPGPPPGKRNKIRLTPLGGSWYHLCSVF